MQQLNTSKPEPCMSLACTTGTGLCTNLLCSVPLSFPVLNILEIQMNLPIEVLKRGKEAIDKRDY